MDLSLVDILVAFTVTAVAAAIQASVGFGFGIVAVPILALVDNDLAPVPQLLLGLPLVTAMAWHERSHVDLTGMGWVLAGRVAGGILGLGLLKAISDSALDAAIGLVVLLLTVVVASGWSPPLNMGSQLAGGVLSGITGMIASIGGPPLALLYRDRPPATMRSTISVVFLIGTLITVALRLAGSEIDTTDVWVALAMLPALVIGWAVGSRVAGRVNRRVVRFGVLVVSIVAALVLIMRAVLA